jgi:myo-inositol-1(or 4)-monophosphatase
MEARTTNEWDLAACALIAQEAGATVTDREGRPHRFNQPSPVLHGIVAATPALHVHALDRLEQARRSWQRTQA